MSTETRSKKRRASVATVDAGKTKKAKEVEVGKGLKRKSVEDTSANSPKRPKAQEPAEAESKTKPSKKSRKSVDSEDKEVADAPVAKESKSKKSKGSKVKEPVAEPEEVAEEDVEDSDADSDEDEVDDQTQALLKGFESDNDDVKDPEEEGYEPGTAVPSLDKNIQKKIKAAQKAEASDKPGVVYVGRIPHGFYEQEMKQYFGQFGDISNLRVSRNRKTGRAKHFAFIEFKSADVAEIVAKTMDSYLLFGHILKCKVVAPEQVHPKLWEGANRRFKKVPWNKMEGRKLKMGMTAEAWDRRVQREEERRAKKEEALKSMGYEFQAPKLKSAKEIELPQQEALPAPATTDANEEEPKRIEAPVVGAKPAADKAKASKPTTKKSKKTRKST